MSAIAPSYRYSKIVEGQITKENSKRLSTLLRSNPKRTDWKAIRAILRTYHPNKTDAPNLDGLLHQALGRSCLDPSGVSVGTVQLLLQKTKRLSLQDRVRYASAAVRCRNRKVLRALIDSDASVLFCSSTQTSDQDENTTEIGSSAGGTLLHMICEEHGWNDEIAFVLDQILRNNNGNNNNNNNNNDDDDDGGGSGSGSGSGKYTYHEGLFQETLESEMPLKLSLQAGSDLEEILDYTRMQHPTYMERKLDRLSQIVAEYSNDMTVFSNLVDEYGARLLDSSHPNDGSTPLAFACYYQNEDMIRLLLEEHYKMNRAKFGERGPSKKRNPRLGVLKRLVSRNKEGTTPLGHLLLNVGDPDAENAWRCIYTCIDFFCNPNDNDNDIDDDDGGGDRGGDHERQRMSRLEQQRFPILHLFLLHAWDALVAKKNCIKILERIVQRLGIDLCVVDTETGSTVLSVVIEKLSANSLVKSSRKSGSGKALQILDFFVTSAAPPLVPWNYSPAKNHRPATTRDATGRLPLHSACQHSLPWKRGLKTIVDTNVPALEATDPITRLPPFAHCAVGPRSDLDSIYELLRLNPGVMDSVLPTTHLV